MTIKHKVISGLKWTTVSTVVSVLVNILKISILARFLDVQDFGLMALVSFFLLFFDIFMDMGISVAILHKQNISRNEYSSLYWINIVISLFLFGLICYLSPLIGAFYLEPELSELLPLAGLGVIFSAIGKQFKTVLQREMNFRTLAGIEISALLISLVISIFLAIYGFGVYALVVSSLVQYLLNGILGLIFGFTTSPISFHFNYSETKPFLKLGVFHLGSEIVNYFNRDLDLLLIGKFLGSEVLGGYSLAKQLARRPLMVLAPVILRVFMATFPKFQNDEKKLLRLTKELLSSSSVIMSFIYSLVFLFAQELILLLYGVDFLYLEVYVQLFSALMFFRFIGGLSGVLTVTKGRMDIGFYWNLFTLLIFPTVMYFAQDLSLEWIIVCLVVTQFVLTLIPIWAIIYYNLIGLDFKSYVHSVLSPLMVYVLFICCCLFCFDFNGYIKSFLLGSFMIIFVFQVSKIRSLGLKGILTKIYGIFIRN